MRLNTRYLEGAHTSGLVMAANRQCLGGWGAIVWKRTRRTSGLATAAFGCAMMMIVAAPANQLPLEDATRAAGLPTMTATVTANGTTIYYRDIGDASETVVLLHGYPETGDAFASIAPQLGRSYRLIVPDLRGFGNSPPTASGYDKRTVAVDVADLLDGMGVGQVHLVGHDLGARVAFSFALQFPARLRSLTITAAFIEGLAGTQQFKQFAPTNARTQHFSQYAKVDEAVARHSGKEQELILSFMNSRSRARQFGPEDTTLYLRSLQRPGALRAAFMYYEAFGADEAFVAGADKTNLREIPTLTIGCEGPSHDILFRQLSAAGMLKVRHAVLRGCEHWVFEEKAAEALSLLSEFLAAQ